MTLHAITHQQDPGEAVEALHRVVAQMLRLNSRPGVLWFHALPGDAKSRTTGARLAAMGVRPGVARLTLTLPGPKVGRTAFLELMAPDAIPSPEQKVFRADAENAKALYQIARTEAEARHILINWSAIKASGRAMDERRAAE